MITFKKKSLHYKFNNLVKDLDFTYDATCCKSLCSYFWSTVWNICMCTVTTIMIFLILSLAGGAVSQLWDLEPQLLDFTYLWIVGFVSFVLVIVTLFAVVYTSVETPKFIVNKFKVSYSDKEPSVVREWIKANKDKVCPMIKFED